MSKETLPKEMIREAREAVGCFWCIMACLICLTVVVALFAWLVILPTVGFMYAMGWLQ